MTSALKGLGRWMRRHPILAAGIGVPSVIVAWILFPILWVLVFGLPELIVSRETTFITEPLDEDGLPDYVAAWNQRMGEGVTPENNAAAYLWEATGPVFGRSSYRNSTPADAERIRRAQGFDPVPLTGDYLISGSSWIADKLAPVRSTLTPEDYERALDSFLEDVERLTQTPWRADKHPEVAAWLQANALPLQTLHEAVSLPDYFEPVIADHDPARSMTGALRYFEISQAPDPMELIIPILRAKICRHIGEGQLSEARQELVTLYRFLHHWANRANFGDLHSTTLIWEPKAFYLHGLLCNAPGLTPELARKIRHDLEDLGPTLTQTEGVELVDYSTRIGVLEVIVEIASQRIPQDLLLAILYREEMFKFVQAAQGAGVDWNTALRCANQILDEAVDILSEADPLVRQQRLVEFHERLHGDSPWDLVGRVASPLAGLKGRGRSLGWLLTGLLIDLQVKYVDRFITRSESCHAVAITGYALAEYKAIHGGYPERLEELSPEILETVPVDAHTAKPLVYVVSDDRQSMKVYSLGDNRVDDLGVNRTDPDTVLRSADDLGIRTGEFAGLAPGGTVPSD